MNEFRVKVLQWAATAVVFSGVVTSCSLAPAAEVVDGPDGKKAIVMTVEEVKQCKAGGGCMILSLDELKEIVLEARRSCGVRI